MRIKNVEMTGIFYETNSIGRNCSMPDEIYVFIFLMLSTLVCDTLLSDNGMPARTKRPFCLSIRRVSLIC